MHNLHILLLLSLPSEIEATITMNSKKNIDAVCEQRMKEADRAYDEFEAARKAFDEHWNSATYCPEDEENIDSAPRKKSSITEPPAMNPKLEGKSALSHSAMHNVDSGTRLAEAASRKANEGTKHTVDSYYAMDIENARQAMQDDTRSAFEKAIDAAKEAAKAKEEESNMFYEGNMNAMDRAELGMHSNF